SQHLVDALSLTKTDIPRVVVEQVAHRHLLRHRGDKLPESRSVSAQFIQLLLVPSLGRFDICRSRGLPMLLPVVAVARDPIRAIVKAAKTPVTVLSDLDALYLLAHPRPPFLSYASSAAMKTRLKSVRSSTPLIFAARHRPSGRSTVVLTTASFFIPRPLLLRDFESPYSRLYGCTGHRQEGCEGAGARASRSARIFSRPSTSL